MEELIYIIGDTELGKSDVMDDFSDDEVLIDFIAKIGHQQNDPRVTLILNGDIFDFLKMAYKDKYPVEITEDISLWKLEQIILHHRNIFVALKNFLSNPKHSIYFIIGNHDADLVWPGVQNRIKRELLYGNRIKFDFWFDNSDVHVEHGNLVDPFFMVNTKKPIVEYKGNKILSLPWGAQASISHLVKIKAAFPKEEQMYPKQTALNAYPDYRQASNKVKFNLAMKKLLIDPVKHFGDPNFKTPYVQFFKHFLRFGSDVLNDEKFIPSRFKSLIKKYPGKKAYILGHSHVLHKSRFASADCIVTDTWRDEFDMTKNNQKKPKSFAEVKMKNGRLEKAELKVL